MKKYILTVVFLFLGFSCVLNAQSRASATVSATIVTPIKIVKNSDLNFGNLTTNGGAGVVVLAAGSVASRTSSSNVTMPAVTGNVTAAVFAVSGEVGFAYSITLPANDHIISNGTDKMVVNEFTSSALKTLSAGEDVIYLGATVHVDAGQEIGSYSSLDSGFEVAVNYN